MDIFVKLYICKFLNEIETTRRLEVKIDVVGHDKTLYHLLLNMWIFDEILERMTWSSPEWNLNILCSHEKLIWIISNHFINNYYVIILSFERFLFSIFHSGTNMINFKKIIKIYLHSRILNEYIAKLTRTNFPLLSKLNINYPKKSLFLRRSIDIVFNISLIFSSRSVTVYHFYMKVSVLILEHV